VLRASEVEAFGTAGTAGAIVDDGGVTVLGLVVVAGWAITGAAMVKARKPIANRENFNILISDTLGGKSPSEQKRYRGESRL
jgi:hypothetical protein